MSYLAIKHLHMGCVAISLVLFLTRGLLVLTNHPLKHIAWKIAPHLVDTTLLAAAITLAYQSQQYPFAQNWLTAKVLALLLYIALGSIAIKHGRTPQQKKAAFAAALLVYIYIVCVAITRSATPWV